MKITIDIKETERGDIAIDFATENRSTATPKERVFASAIKELLKVGIPAMAQDFGCGVMSGEGKPQNG